MATEIAVVGAHLRGQPLHFQLTDLDAEYVRSDHTSDCYRLYALDTVPPKPGLVRVAQGGTKIALEIYRLSYEAFGIFVTAIPSPLCIGRVRLEAGGEVAGFLCEPIATQAARDISEFGGWLGYLRSV